MGEYVVWIGMAGVALLAAGGVLVMAMRGSDEGTSWKTFISDFQAGWRDRRNREPEPEPVDVAFDELFETESRPGDDYLHLDEFAGMIERTGDRAGHLLHHEKPERPTGRTSTSSPH